jgi:hypothetical protein
MDLKHLLTGLWIEFGRYEQTYQEGRARHPALAGFATAKDLAKDLRLESFLTYQAHEAVAVSLIAEQQRAQHPLWQALLVYAYAPMLRRLVGRCNGDDAEERLQRVLYGFLEIVRRLSVQKPPVSTALSLRLATTRAVLGRRRRTTVNPQFVPIDEETMASPEGWSANAEAMCEFRRVIEAEPNGMALFGLLLATVADDEKLFAYQRRTHPQLHPRFTWKTYRRLRKERARILTKLRRRIGGASMFSCNKQSAPCRYVYRNGRKKVA